MTQTINIDDLRIEQLQELIDEKKRESADSVKTQLDEARANVKLLEAEHKQLTGVPNSDGMDVRMRIAPLVLVFFEKQKKGTIKAVSDDILGGSEYGTVVYVLDELKASGRLAYDYDGGVYTFIK
jgi:ADP-ribosylglycohydrolase